MSRCLKVHLGCEQVYFLTEILESECREFKKIPFQTEILKAAYREAGKLPCLFNLYQEF